MMAALLFAAAVAGADQPPAIVPAPAIAVLERNAVVQVGQAPRLPALVQRAIVTREGRAPAIEGVAGTGSIA